MTNLFDTVSNDIQSAMLAKDKVRLETLRGIKKEFIEAKTAKGATGELSDEKALKILQKMVKQRKDSAEIYQQQNRTDLAEREFDEITVIESYLPEQISQEELEGLLSKIIVQTGVKSLKEIGKVMSIATETLAGKAEGRLIAETVKRLMTDGLTLVRTSH
ncbi:MAG: GatB/YqeY domain-containing protein [Dysgonamonadaceae bacterium]|jgi:uncharacterized protein YqeY|nr:GatB/YqeY domain-containing protein [Dysgonamonadaceae bacterium]